MPRRVMPETSWILLSSHIAASSEWTTILLGEPVVHEWEWGSDL